MRSGPSTSRDSRVRRGRARAACAASSGRRQSAAEQDERDDEDDRGAPVEEPRRDREVLDRPDPVRDEVSGSTVSTASSASGWWSSTSKRPGMVAVIGMRTGLPGRDRLLDVVSVHVHRLAGVRADDDHDHLALLQLGSRDPAPRAARPTTITIVRAVGLGFGRARASRASSAPARRRLGRHRLVGAGVVACVVVAVGIVSTASREREQPGDDGKQDGRLHLLVRATTPGAAGDATGHPPG